MGLIDTHAHLAMLEHSSLEEVLRRAEESKIEKMVTVSVDEKSWEQNQRLAEKLSHVWYSLGLHPHEAKDWQALKPRFFEYLKKSQDNQKCVALGEMGLDFFYNHSDEESQRQCFKEQLEIAQKENLPIIIHCRDAFRQTYNLIREVGLGSRGGVMHCFTGGVAEAEEAIDLGLIISFSGILTFKTAKNIQEAASKISLDKIVLETDCPFLAPVPFRGKPNEPSLLPHTASFLANLRGVSTEVIENATSKNAGRLFDI